MNQADIVLQILIQKYMGLIVATALRYRTNSVVSIEDYISVGCIALIRAYQTHDEKRGPWINYLIPCIRNAVYKESNRFIGPYTLTDRDITDRHILSKLIDKCNIKDTEKLKKIAKKLKISVKTIKQILEILKPLRSQLSSISVTPQVSVKLDLSKIMFLSQKEVMVVKGRMAGKSMREIAKDMRVSKETIRRWFKKACCAIAEKFDFEDFIVC